MRCFAVSSNFGLNMNTLIKALESFGKVTKYGRALHVHYHGEIFFFQYGVLVCWDLDEDTEEMVTNLMKEHKTEELGASAKDIHQFEMGEKAAIIDDVLVLPDGDVLTKLACSHALAQSVKLDGFESTLRKSTEVIKNIPKDLAKRGKIRLSRKAIRHHIGQLVVDRNAVNLHLEMLNIPRFFWSHADVEPLYLLTKDYLDLDRRVSTLNRRLEVMHELFDMLAVELNNQHSAMLEWIIILLITFEVLLSIGGQVLHWF